VKKNCFVKEKTEKKKALEEAADKEPKRKRNK
jgi:hypothetical protein